jgi:hypothetical protein
MKDRMSVAYLLTALAFSHIAIANSDTPLDMLTISLLPHQAGVCDLICAGTVLSTNGEESADFAVDDVLWGRVTASNITVRSIYPLDGFKYKLNVRYLLFAFTNNWWASDNSPFSEVGEEKLFNHLCATNQLPAMMVFDGYRTIYPRDTAIPFDLINFNGSNYWTATRALVTNLVDIARIRHDKQLMRQTITDIAEGGWANSGLSPFIWNRLWLYKFFRDW